MHLPCPSCGTVYDIDTSIYVPSTVFECVRCQAHVTVPDFNQETSSPSPSPHNPFEDTPLNETAQLIETLGEVSLEEGDLIGINDSMGASDDAHAWEQNQTLGRIEVEKRAVDNLVSNSNPVAPTHIHVDAADTAIHFLEAKEMNQAPVPTSSEQNLEPQGNTYELEVQPSADSLNDSTHSSFSSSPASQEQEVDLFGVHQELELPPLEFDDTDEQPPIREETFNPFALPEDYEQTSQPPSNEATDPALPSDLELQDSLELPELPDLMDALTDDSVALTPGVSLEPPSSAAHEATQSSQGAETQVYDIEQKLQGTPPPPPEARITPLTELPPQPPQVSGANRKAATNSNYGPLILTLVGITAALTYAYLYTDLLQLPAPTTPTLTKPTPPTPPKATPTTPAQKPSTSAAPQAPKPLQPSPDAEKAQLELTNENIDILSYHELLAGIELLDAAKPLPPQKNSLRHWAQFRLATTYKHEPSHKALNSQADQAVAFLNKVGPTPKSPSEELANHLATLIVAKRTVDFDLNAWKSHALKQKGPQGARYAYALGIALPKGPKHNARLIALLDRAIAIAPIFPDAVMAKANHLFGRNRISAGIRTIQLFATAKAPHESLLIASQILVRRKLYSALSLVAEKINLSAFKKTMAPTLISTFEALQTYQNVLQGNIPQLIKDTDRALETTPKNLEHVLRLVRYQAIAEQDPQTTIQTKQSDFQGGERGQLDYEAIRLELEKRPKNLSEARKKLASFKKSPSSTSNPWVLISTGDIAFSQGKYKNALKAYQKARKLDENLSLASLKVELAQAKVDKRLPNLSRLTKLAKASKLAEVRYAMAQTMNAKNNVAAAQSLYETILWTNPTVTSPLQLVSEYTWATFQTGDAERAMNIATTFHKLNPMFAPMVEVLINIAQSTGDKTALVQWYAALDRINPFNKETTLELAKAWLDLEQPENARTVLTRLLSEKPQERDAEVIKQLARTWANIDDAKCRSLLFESIRYEAVAETYILLAQLEIRRQSPDNAIEAYKEALKISPSKVAPRFALVELLLTAGKLDDSIRQLNTLVRQKPKLAKANVLLGDTYRELGNSQKAVNHYYQALRSSKPTEELLLKTARLELYELNQIKHAVENFERVLQINPENAEAHYRLGFALKDLDQTQRAKEEFKTYLELSPDGEFAEEVQGELLNLKD